MLNDSMEKSLSKWMTKLLRHTPEAFGLVLDPEDGSCPLNELLQVIQTDARWSRVTQEDVAQVVRNSDKQRFELKDGRIRARYGHSHDKVKYTPSEPPAVLYHGTNARVLPAIEQEGLRPMDRQYVHLSEGTHFASLAGSRRGKLVILKVDARAAMEAGAVFYYAGHEVWLADKIPPFCLSVMQQREEEDFNER